MSDEESFQPDIRKLKEGDEAEWSAVVDYWDPRLCRYLFRTFNLRPDAIADICQEVLMTAVKTIANLKEGQRFSSWLFSIAYRRGVDHVRRIMGNNDRNDALTTSIDQDPSEETSVPNLRSQVLNPREAFTRGEDHSLIRDAVHQMRENCRDVILRFYFQGQSTEEIAEDLHVSQKTITARLSKCRGALKDIVERLRSQRAESEDPMP